MTKYKHGLAVMRAQPFHRGHESLIDKMIEDCSHITIILGSMAESRTLKNPFSFEERQSMIKNIYPKQKNTNIFGLVDIPNDDEWSDYVINNVKEKSVAFGDADAYYCGDDENGNFFASKLKIEKVDRNLQKGYRNISATDIRKMILGGNDVWKNYIPPCNVYFIENLIPTLFPLFHPVIGNTTANQL
jgi:cytidyltransferase-like protein